MPLAPTRVDPNPPAFRPPFCPRIACEAHSCSFLAPFRFRRAGSYFRRCDQRTLRRFRCAHCASTFSAASFSSTYYLKRPELQIPIAALLCAGSAHRQIARTLACSPSTVTRQASRLGRHALLFSAWALDSLPALLEPVVFDHFETFVASQHDRLAIGTAVGGLSWFVYTLDPAPHARPGRLSAPQRRLAALRKARHRPIPRRGYLRSHRRVLDLLLDKSPCSLDLVHDGHPAYRACEASHPQRERLRVRLFPNPPRGPKSSPRSPKARARDRAMFPVDLLHALWRHSEAHHHRETIAFARRSSAAMERAHLLALWRNFVKRRSERLRRAPTPAMVLGLAQRPLSWKHVLARRLFPARLEVPDSWMNTYRRAWIHPDVGPTRPHDLKYAF